MVERHLSQLIDGAALPAEAWRPIASKRPNVIKLRQFPPRATALLKGEACLTLRAQERRGADEEALIPAAAQTARGTTLRIGR